MFNQKSLYRLVVRTPPFHGDNTGSNPVKDAFYVFQILSNDR